MLLCLLSLVLSAKAQSRSALSLNSVARFSSQSSSFTIPPQTQLTVTVALCSSPSSPPRVFISNATNSATGNDPGPDGGQNVYEIVLQQGLGNFTGPFSNGGVLAIGGLPLGASFQVGVSTDGPLHEILSDYPLFGDSTNNQAILFSHPFALPPPIIPPKWPNFTLPAANATLPDLPSSSPNLTLVVSKTSNAPLLHTACYLESSAVSAEGKVVNTSSWLRNPVDGWRTEYLLAGLEPQTNYTAFVIQDDHKISGPLNFVTKSTSFPCTLVHSLPYCPSTSYAIPLSPPTNNNNADNNFPIYDTSTLPDQLQNSFIQTLQNFTVSLSTFACGRDWYSPIVGCDDCQREYRKWLCTALFPRCTEPSPSNTEFITPNPVGNGIINAIPTDSQNTQTVLSALLPIPSPTTTTTATQTTPSIPYITQAYTKLLPCIESCTAVDRACPPFLQFRCPTSVFNGAASYGFGYVDGADGGQGEGVVESAQDRWGNVWCNAE